MLLYVLHGDDTLGPYTLPEAAQLVRAGLLLTSDYAAREGDANWQALSVFLPAEFTTIQSAEANPPPPLRYVRVVPPEVRRARWLALVPAALVVLLGVGWLWHRQHGEVTSARRATAATAAKGSPLPAQVAPAPSTPRPSPPTVAKAAQASAMFDAGDVVPVVTPRPDTPESELHGTLSLVGKDGQSVTFGDVRVAAYPWELVAPLLDQANARTRAELTRLAPLIAAAQAEHDTLVAAAQAAADAYQHADPNDPLLSSLSFAASQSKNRVRATDNDLNYLLGQRREATDGEGYFRDLPAALVETRTDEAGRYVLTLPVGGKFVVAASVSPADSGVATARYWLLQITLEDGGRRTLDLNDGDVASARNTASLLPVPE